MPTNSSDKAHRLDVSVLPVGEQEDWAELRELGLTDEQIGKHLYGSFCTFNKRLRRLHRAGRVTQPQLTAERRRKVAEMAEAGLDARAIWEQLGVHHSVVQNDLRRLGYSTTVALQRRRTAQHKRREAVRARYQEFTNTEALAAALGTSQRLVCKDMAALGLPSYPSRRHQRTSA